MNGQNPVFIGVSADELDVTVPSPGPQGCTPADASCTLLRSLRTQASHLYRGGRLAVDPAGHNMRVKFFVEAMTASVQPPFSASVRGQHRQVDESFPETARQGLLHILFEAVESEYVAGWHVVARELQRAARLPPQPYDLTRTATSREARADAENALAILEWDKVFDFCERLHGYLAREVGSEGEYGFETRISRGDVQAYIADELQRLFLEEGFAYEFAEGAVRRRGRKHTVEVTSRAQVVLGAVELASARRHFSKALEFFRHPTKPDLENAVKEAVCAVEAAGKSLFPSAKAATLGDLAKWLNSSTEVEVPKALVQTITGVYAFRSGGAGVGHGGATGGVASLEVTEYVLSVCASQIIYFVDLASSIDQEIPF